MPLPDFSVLRDLAPPQIEQAALSGYYKYAGWKADREHTQITTEARLRSDAPSHVMLVIIDALRPDFEPDIGLDFGRAIAPGTWTFPSVTSILSGLYPHEHEAVAHTHPDDESYVMPEQAEITQTLPAVLNAAGYDTYGAFGFMTPFLAARGWFENHRVYQDAEAQKVFEGYRQWRRTRKQTFAYLHLGDLHAPLEPPEEYVRQRDVDTSIEDLERLVRYTDTYDGSPECQRFRTERLKLYGAALDYVEDLLRELVLNLRDDTMIVVTGDHGEAHWEHYEIDRQFTDSRPNYGVGHGGTPFDMIARVPVGVTTPNGRIPTDRGTLSLRDLPATISRQILTDHQFEGYEWQNGVPDSRVALCEATRYGTERKAAYRRDRKIIRGERDEITLAAALGTNHGEQFDESFLDDEDTRNLLNNLPDYWSDGNIDPNTSRVVEDQLSALGYT